MKYIEIELLDDVLLVTKKIPSKPVIFCLMPNFIDKEEPKEETPEIDLKIESYVRLSSLSDELQNKIRKKLKLEVMWGDHK